MPTRDRGYGFVAAAFAIAVVACGVVAFAPLTTTATTTSVPGDVADEESGTQPPVVRERQSTVEAQGWAEVAPFTVTLLLVAGVPLLAPSGRRARTLRSVSAGLLFIGVVLSILSVGVFLLPLAVLMLIAAVRAPGRPERARVDSSWSKGQ